MDTYCWIHSTFSVPVNEIGIAGEKGFYPGVASHSNGPDDEQQLRYHKYYQWICFTLFFQAILFYVPRYLWKTWENGRIKMLVQDMNVPILDQETKRDRIKLIIDYFTVNRRNHQLYTLKFLFCEGIVYKFISFYVWVLYRKSKLLSSIFFFFIFLYSIKFDECGWTNIFHGLLSWR